MNNRPLPATGAPLNQRLRRNNFDLLRFAFSFVVFQVHAHALSGVQELAIFSRFLSSEIAVKSFFVFSSYNWSDYWSFPLLKYLAANLLFLNFPHPNLPGLFQDNLLQAVNGALWTLKVEVMFYLSVPLAVMAFTRLGRLPVLGVLYVGSVIYSAAMGALAEQTGSGLYLEMQRQFPSQLSFFVAGAAGYYYFQYLSRHALPLMVAAVAAFVLRDWLPWGLVQPLALGMVVVYIACFFPLLGNFGKYGDFSYGIYIVHFPILQLLIAYGFFETAPWLALLTAAVLVVAAAILLWHMIEKPFLRRSSHYVATNRG